MANYEFDQAEGLRRLLARPKPRVVSFLSTLSDEDKSALLFNLSACLVRTGSSVVSLNARMPGRGMSKRLHTRGEASLAGVAKQTCTLHDALSPIAQGLVMVNLYPSGKAFGGFETHVYNRINQTCCALAAQNDFLLIDAELDHNDNFPVPIIDSGDIVVQLSASPASIKMAYATIKRLSSRLGRRPFSVIISDCTEDEARQVFRNLSLAASKYLALPLRSLGFVPEDDHVKRASDLGRSVIDAFPLAGASVAFRRLAGHFTAGTGYQRVG